MLGTTSMHDATSEFKAARCSQIHAQQQKAAAGALALDGPAEPAGALTVQDLRKRLVVHMAARPLFVRPVRLAHGVAGCVHTVADAFGPVAVALLAGTFGIVLMALVVALALGIRHALRFRRERMGYQALEQDAEAPTIVFDADELRYNHHQQMTMAAQPQMTTMMTSPPPYP